MSLSSRLVCLALRCLRGIKSLQFWLCRSYLFISFGCLVVTQKVHGRKVNAHAPIYSTARRSVCLHRKDLLIRSVWSLLFVRLFIVTLCRLLLFASWCVGMPVVPSDFRIIQCTMHPPSAPAFPCYRVRFALSLAHIAPCFAQRLTTKHTICTRFCRARYAQKIAFAAQTP